MRKIITYFIDNSFVVNLISFFLIATGLISLLSMQRDLIGQMPTDTISVQASLSGASASQMEKFVTYPIEEAISNFAGIEEVTSSSANGSSYITVNIKDGYKDVDDLYNKIDASVMALSPNLPSDIEDLNVSLDTSSDFWFSTVSFLGFDENNNLHQEWLQRSLNELSRLPGIVRVADYSSKPQIYIKFDPSKLRQYRLSLKEIQQRITAQFKISPIGSFDKGLSSINFEMTESVSHIDHIKNIIIKGNASGRIIKLSDIATISYGIEERKTRWKTNGKPTATLVLFKDLDSDIISLKENFDKILETINKTAPQGIEGKVTGDGPAYIERQLNSLNNNAIVGILLVLVSLFIFLGLRSSLITSLGIPLAYFGTFTILHLLGVNIDLISVVGMILVLGILVDDAIIVSEQYMQYLEQGHKPRDAAIKAVESTIGPVTGTVLTTVIAFTPILFSQDGLSQILYAIPLVVISTLFISWIESFFILPNHLAHFVKKPSFKTKNHFIDNFKSFYTATLNMAFKIRYVLLFVFVGFMAYSLYFAKENVPTKYDLRIGSQKLRILAVLKKSDSLEETEQNLTPLWNALEKIDKEKYSDIVTTYGASYINGIWYEDYRYAKYDIRFSETYPDIEGAKKEISDYLNTVLPELQTDQFELLKLESKMDGHDTAKDNTLYVSILGNDAYDLDQIINAVKGRVDGSKGLKSIFVNPKLKAETYSFEPNLELLEQIGLSTFDVSTQIRAYVSKTEMDEFRYKGRNIKVYSYIQDEKNLSFINTIPIQIGNGQSLDLKRLGNWTNRVSLKKIEHKDLKRIFNIELSFDPEIIKKEIFTEDIKKKIEPLKSELPEITIRVEDADEEGQKNKASMNEKLIYCIFLILLVLALTLKSLIQPILIGLAIPFGVIGVIWAFYFHGATIDVMALVGIIGMAGVVVNDSLILVDTVNKKRKSWLDFKREDIIDACATRLRPIILTSVTTLGGVMPMAYGLGGDSGFTKPLALSMGWGLSFATIMTLILVPCLLEIQRDFMFFYSRRFVKAQPMTEIMSQDEILEEGFIVAAPKKEERPSESLH